MGRLEPSSSKRSCQTPQANGADSRDAPIPGQRPGGACPKSSTPAPSTPDLSSLLGALSGGNAPQETGPSLGGITPQTLSLMTRLGPLLSQANREDDATRLLRALRPLLGESRQKKVDEAIQILQMLRLLPLLKESGVFSGLLSGLL